MSKDDKVIVTSSEVNALLRTRYAHPEWALCFEVANATGAHGSRYADAVAMCLYPSRGLTIHGFEVKVSKSDFMREIEKPDKSVAVQQYCDQWWLVAPAHAVDETLIPKTWGWLRVDKGKLFPAKKAADLDAKPIDRKFMAALVRRANEVDHREVDVLVEKKIEVLRENDRKHLENEIKRRTRDIDDAKEQLKKLRERIGEDDWRYLDRDEVARAVKFVRAAGVLGTYNSVETLLKNLRGAVTKIERAGETVFGKQGKLDLEAAE